jgi:uncharacterized membrane protein YjdF
MSFAIDSYQVIGISAVVVMYASLLYFTRKKASFSRLLYFGFFLWGLLHLLASGLSIDGKVLYGIVVVPISDTLPIIRFDQIIHVVGFGATALFVYELIEGKLKDIDRFSLGFTIVMAGLGIGALNEIIEFLISFHVAENKVGGYTNNSLDLIADLIGALLVLPIVFFRENKKSTD